MLQLFTQRKRLGFALIPLAILALWPFIQNITVDGIVSYYASRSLPFIIVSLLLLYAIKALLIVIPITVLHVSTAILLPLPWAFIITYLGLVLALSIGFFNGRRLGQEKAEELLKKSPRMEKIFKKHNHNMKLFCFLSRLTPLPFDLLSMFSGAMDVKYGNFILFSLLGLSVKLIPIILTTAAIL